MSPQQTTVVPTESECFAQEKNEKIGSDSRITDLGSLSDLENELKTIPLPKTTKLHIFTFIMLGIASLAGWNVVLSAIQFYIDKFVGVDIPKIESSFPIPIMFTNFIGGIACPYFAVKFSYNFRIFGGLFATCFTLIATALIAMYVRSVLGYWLIMIVLLIQGFVDSIATNSLIDLAGMMEPKLNHIYWTFTAFSGLSMNIIRIIGFFIFESESGEDNSTIAYFVSAILFILVACFLQIQLTRSHYFQTIQKRDHLRQRIELLTSKVTVLEVTKDISFKNYMKYFSQAFKYAGAIQFFLWFIYLQTFLVFPKASSIYRNDATIFDDKFRVITFIAVFNLGDFIGKFFGGLKALQRVSIAYGVVISRLGMIALFIIILYGKGGDFILSDLFGLAVQLVFSITNGYATTALMVLGMEKAQHPSIARLINFAGGFAITFGISIGSVLAYLIENPNKN